MKICVIGTGYVGLVTGVCFAAKGNDVTCVDIDEAKVASLKLGTSPIYEPGLTDLLKSTIADKHISFTTELGPAAGAADVIFLALPTPPAEDGSADLTAVMSVAKQLARHLQGYTIIVNKSTVPVGSAERVKQIITDAGGKDFDVVSNPEFLREGFAIADFMQPDRVVLGSSSERATTAMRELYEPFVDDEKFMVMDEKSSEMSKYAANSFLATKISFINEIANICDEIGADVSLVAKAMGADERIGRRFLQAGIGYGGSCFPKDVLALQHTSQQVGYKFRLLDAVLAINTSQPNQLLNKVNTYFDGNLGGKTIAVWGLSFKPDTDDTRESPAISIIRELLASGVTIKAYDPESGTIVKELLADEPNFSIANDQYEALETADGLLIATEWQQFKQADPATIKEHLRTPLVFDGRNIFDPNDMKAAGIEYHCIGRPQQPIS